MDDIQKKVTHQTKSLEGVTLLHNPEAFETGDVVHEFPPDSPIRESIHEFTRTQRHVADLALSLGARVQAATAESAPPVGREYGTYWLCRTYADGYDTTQAYIAQADAGIGMIERVPVSAIPPELLRAYGDSLAPDNSVVLAYSALERGCGKYLLDSPEQWQRFVDFVDSTLQAGWQLDLSRFEVRPYIPTPSDRYTSMRVVTDAVGTIIASGLFYSEHTKTGQPRRIVNDRINYTRPGSIVNHIRVSLEDPNSPYFLDGIDARSNIDCGGRIIPLLGSGSERRFVGLEADILRAHGIDPERPSMSARPAAVAARIGRELGPNVNLVMATDFLDGACCEINNSPGAKLFFACHPQARQAGVSGAVAMRQIALTSLASGHSRPAGAN